MSKCNQRFRFNLGELPLGDLPWESCRVGELHVNRVLCHQTVSLIIHYNKLVKCSSGHLI